MTIDLNFPALYALRDRLAAITEEIGGHLADVTRIRSAPTHADDIAEQLRRGIDNAAAEYEARLATYFNDPHAGDTSLISGDGIVAYLMRDHVAAKVPDLIKRFCPSAERGMPSSERRQLLQEANGHLDRLSAERESARQALAREKGLLGHERRSGAFANDAKARGAIEREERTLAADLDAIGAAQHELQQLRSGGSRLA